MVSESREGIARGAHEHECVYTCGYVHQDGVPSRLVGEVVAVSKGVWTVFGNDDVDIDGVPT